MTSYRRSWLSADLLAGLTVAALLVPEGMAYAALAGVPPETAFYAAPVALLAYAALGSSRQLVVAVSATVAVLSAATVGELAAVGSPEFVTLTAALAVLAGVVSVLAGLLRLGRLSQFLSEPVLTGFVSGLALVIALRQVPDLLGIEGGEGSAVARLATIVANLPELHLPTLALGTGILALLLVIERVLPRVPAALVGLVVGIVAVAALDLERRGVEVVGELPAGLVAPTLPDVDLGDVLALLGGALGITLVSFAEAIGPVRAFAAEHGYEADPDRELVAMGAANLAAGFFRGFPVGSSLSKSAANDRAGARTPLALVVAAVVTALVALFATSLFADLPEAALAAVVIVAVARMVKLGVLRRLRRVRRADFGVALVGLASVLVLEVLPALLVTVVVSLVVLVARAAAPRVTVLGRRPGTLELVDVRLDPAAHTVPGLLVLRLDQELFFANARSVHDAVLTLVAAADPPVREVLVELSATTDLDVPGADVLSELHTELGRHGVDLRLTRVRPPVAALLARCDWPAPPGLPLHARTLLGVVEHLRRHDGLAAERRTLLTDADAALGEVRERLGPG